MTSQATSDIAFSKRFLPLFIPGAVGLLGVIPLLAPLLEKASQAPDAPDLPLPLLIALSLIQPALLLAVAVAVGVWLAPRLGLRSHLSENLARGESPLPAIGREAPAAALAGALTGLAMLALDAAFMPLIGEALRAMAAAQPRTVAVTVSGMLYGGITEELITRWGLVTLLAWAGWRLFERGRPGPAPRTMWAAIVVVAILFGAGHLGAVAMNVPLTPALVLRTVLVNAVGGVVFGWLYWKRSLEAAMMAHATVHVVFSVVAWSGVLGE